jgi:hypothetical protein
MGNDPQNSGLGGNNCYVKNIYIELYTTSSQTIIYSTFDFSMLQNDEKWTKCNSGLNMK